MYERIKPFIAGSVRIAEAETVATILVKVKFHGAARFEPRLDNTELTAEKKIVGGDYVKHWRSFLRHFDWAQASIDWTDEVEFHSLGVKCRMHRETCTGRKADHPKPSGINSPFGST